MKKIVLVATALLLAASVSFAAEESPDRAFVKLSPVPPECLNTGSAIKDGVKYTCTSVETAEVWNDPATLSYRKEIFQASSQKEVSTPPVVQLGLVVRQDRTHTRLIPDTKKVTVEQNEVARVERREGYKYRYVRP